MRKPSRTLFGTWLAVALLTVSTSFAWLITPTEVSAQQQIDPEKVSLKESDLRPGFKLNKDPDKTLTREPIPGIKVYEADFTRERTKDNLNSGPIEVHSLVARTPGNDVATEQFSVSRQALVGAEQKWTESAVSKLGDESTGLSFRGNIGDGPGIAHMFLFRKGPVVAGIRVVGLEKATNMAEAEALAAVVLRRIDPSFTNQRAPNVSRTLNTKPGTGSQNVSNRTSGAPFSPGGTSSNTGATTSSSSGTRLKVTTGGGRLRLRGEPSTNASILFMIPEGTTIEVIGADKQAEGRAWKNVKVPNGQTGWVAGEYTSPATQ
jgi:hypothetical protein